jgi:hypothetical protein
MNGGKFDGGQLTVKEKELRDFYSRLLNFTLKSEAMVGKFQSIQEVNRKETKDYDPGLYSYVRYSTNEKLIVVANFSWVTTSNFDLKIPAEVISKWNILDGSYTLKDQLYGSNVVMNVVNGVGTVKLKVKPSESFIFKL